jgi:hypothetical protein
MFWSAAISAFTVLYEIASSLLLLAMTLQHSLFIKKDQGGFSFCCYFCYFLINLHAREIRAQRIMKVLQLFLKKDHREPSLARRGDPRLRSLR